LTSVAERVPLDRIEQRARQAHPARVLLTLLAGLLFGLGWLACRACAVTWLAVAWCASAVIEGWQSAKAGQRAP
jgi:cytochrome c biogenesis protein CcdA